MSRFQQYLSPSASSRPQPENISELPSQAFAQRNVLGHTVFEIVPLIHDGAILHRPDVRCFTTTAIDEVAAIRPNQFQPSTIIEDSTLALLDEKNSPKRTVPGSPSAFTTLVALADIGFWPEYEKTEGEVQTTTTSLRFELEPFITAMKGLIANDQQFSWGAFNRSTPLEIGIIESSRFSNSIIPDFRFEHPGIKVSSVINECVQVYKIKSQAAG